MRYIASVSGGKDSLAMILKILELNYPLTDVVFYDTGMEFNSIYNNINKLKSILSEKNVVLTTLKPKTDFLYDMLIKPHYTKNNELKFGYEWCGRMCRWRTTDKTQTISNYLKSFNEPYKEYIGIAYDEKERIKDKLYPLVDLKMTEKDCLEYCYSKGFCWNENGTELYSVLDRVSCWCCWNKSIKELRNIYNKLPDTWNKLLALQSRIDKPFKDNATLFDLEKRFKQENKQLKLDL